MKKIKLGEICDLKSGYAFKSNDYVGFSNTLNCRMSNIRPGAIFDINYNIKYLPDEYADKYKEFLLHDDDIIIAMTDLAGDPKILGVPAKVITNGYNILQNQRVGKLVIKEKSKINFNFLKYALSNPKNKEYYRKFAGGGLQINISNRDILNVQIPLYDIQEQIEISNKLDKVEKLIDIRKKQIEELDQLIKAQFVEMFQSGNYPKEELGKLCDVRDGTHDSPKYLEESGYKFITSKNIINNEIDFSEVKYISKQDYDKFNTRSKVNYGDILMPMIGTIGKPMIVNIPDDEIDFAIKNVALIKFLDNSQVTNIYIKNLLDSDYFENAILQNKRGGTQKFIALSDIRKMQIEIPPIELQNQFADIVKQIDKQKFKLQKSLEEMEKLQESLMNKYFG